MEEYIMCTTVEAAKKFHVGLDEIHTYANNVHSAFTFMTHGHWFNSGRRLLEGVFKDFCAKAGIKFYEEMEFEGELLVMFESIQNNGIVDDELINKITNYDMKPW